MIKHDSRVGLTRRRLLQLSAMSASMFGARLAFPELNASGVDASAVAAGGAAGATAGIYSSLLQQWCDGLLAHQVAGLQDPALHGGFLCPACSMIHGRCGDAVYPLLRVAHTTGEAKYLQAALQVHAWSERQVSRADGSWINDVTLSSWKGITVFHAIALAEALEHHGSLLDVATRRQWTERLARAAKFLDGFITIETGNINYPVTASLAFVLCGQVLEEPRYIERGRKLAHTSLEYFTENNLLFGEGHPQTGLSPKHCRPVDLGYNVEESLPALALYSVLTDDKVVREKVVAALRTHLEFMLPDGGWDNSWGSRNYKWTWWGSRTSDGCHPAFVLMAQEEPRFLEAAWRNAEMMAACTHENLLYGGPDYFVHGDLPCIHHSFTHAKALATVLDRGGANLVPATRLTLPREEAYGLKSYPEIGTHLAAVGDWRATVTEYDFEYVEHVQAGGGGAGGGGHASGGALSLLFHRRLGPLLTASMTEYQMIEISNQQAFLDSPHMPLTPRIEYVEGKTYTSLSDFSAVLTATHAGGEAHFDARGRLLTASHQPVAGGEMEYHLIYRVSDSAVEITASVSGGSASAASLRFILPVISRSDETVDTSDRRKVRITKPGGVLIVRTDAAQGFDAVPEERTFNLVPGFECVPLMVTMQPGKEIRIRLEMA